MAGGAFASRPGTCVDRLVALRGLGPGQRWFSLRKGPPSPNARCPSGRGRGMPPTVLWLHLVSSSVPCHPGSKNLPGVGLPQA